MLWLKKYRKCIRNSDVFFFLKKFSWNVKKLDFDQKICDTKNIQKLDYIENELKIKNSKTILVHILAKFFYKQTDTW